MTDDLDARLARDAARRRADDAPPPAFDAMLDRATAGRRPRTTWLAVAATVALVVAVVAAVIARPWTGGGDREQSGGHGNGMPRRYTDYLSDGPSGLPSVSGWTGYSRGPSGSVSLQYQPQDNVGFSAVIRHPDDPSTVSVMVTRDTTAECSVANPRVASVEWTSSSVTIVVSGSLLMPKPTGTGSYGFACASPGETPFVVHLDRPLGSREVRDGLRTAPVPVLDPTELPQPGYLPSGYLPDGTQPLDAASGRLIGERDYRNGNDRILVIVGMAEDIPAALATPVDHVMVGTRRAAVTTEAGTCVTWPVRPSVDISVCALGNPQGHLSTSEVVKVARSVQGG
jgi:hypothetical protein